MLVNMQTKTIHFKIVYYGAALSGKTTNVRYIASQSESVSNEFISLETRGERTLFFDTMQLKFGTIGGYQAIFNLYTTPGQMTYITKRKLVLNGVDGLIFVMDSQLSRQRDNLQSWYSLERQLFEIHRNKNMLPIILQMNKRDMPYVADVHKMKANIRGEALPHTEAIAETGEGVFDTLLYIVDRLTQQAVDHLYQPIPALT